MPRYIDADELLRDIYRNPEEDSGERCAQILEAILSAHTAAVAPRAEVFEGVDKFRSDLMNKFIDLCRGNDYNKLTLLKIGDTVDQIYDKQIAELKKKYTQPEPPEES